MVSMHWALRLVALTCLATSMKPAAQVVPPVPPNYSAFIPGNRVAVLNLCDAAASGQFSAYQHYYFIEIVQGAQFPAPTGTLRIDGVLRGTGNYETPLLAPGTQCTTATVETTGIVALNNERITLRITSGYLINGERSLTSNIVSGGTVAVSAPVHPTITLSSTSTINAIGSYPRTATVKSGATTKPFVGLNLTASCTTANGAVVSASPASRRTDFQGRADFTLDASRINVALAGGTPTATCTFIADGDTDPSIAVQAIGVNVDPTIAVSPASLNTTSAFVTATLGAAVPVDFGGVSVDATCNTSLATVTPNYPSLQIGGGSNTATFLLTATGLVTINPNLGVLPTASCTFRVRNSPGGHQASMSYVTANACSFSTLQPRPAQCGNP